MTKDKENKPCTHKWRKTKLPVTYGVFGGATRKTCIKCGDTDDSDAWRRIDYLTGFGGIR